MPLRLLRRIRHVPRSAALLAAVVWVVALGWVDILTGPDLRLSFFYLLPVGIAAWYSGRTAGVAMSILSAGSWLIVELREGPIYQSPPAAYVNSAIRLVCFVAGVWLLTAWRVAGEQLEQLVADRTAALRQLGAQLSAAEDAERSRLAHDLHDGLGQLLSVIKLNLEGAAAATAATAGHPDPQRLADSLSLLDEVIRRTRSLTFDLHPAMLDDLGLVPTLQWYGERFTAQAKVQTTVSETGEPQPLPPAVANYLFRAVKELMANAAKHARPGELVVAAHWRADGLRIVVDDDGAGFDPRAAASLASPGLGLPGIRERIGALGGRFTVESAAGAGTRAILEVPLQPQARPELSERTP